MADKRWILLVEDDLDLQAVVAENLEQVNYPTVRASSVREAILKLRNQPFFAVICDIKLKDGLGTEVIDYIRASKRVQLDANTPIIVVSAHLDRELAAKLMKQVSAALVKPFTMEQLLTKLQQIEATRQNS